MIENSHASLGSVMVHATSYRGHSVDEWTQFLLDRILFISDSMPAPIRDQANAYKEQLRHVIAEHMKNAVDSDRVTITNRLRRAGLTKAAEFIQAVEK